MKNTERQLQIEGLYSRENNDTAISLMSQKFTSRLPSEFIADIRNVLHCTLEETMTYLAMVVSKLGTIEVMERNEHAEIDMFGIIGIISGGYIIENSKTKQDSLTVSQEIHKVMDGVLYDVRWKENTEEGYEEPIAIVDWSIDLGEQWHPEYWSYLPPMVCVPNDWTEESKGGLLNNKKGCTFNRGSDSQPQNILDILNTRQSQGWRLEEGFNAEEYKQFSYKKQIGKGKDPMEARRISEIMTLSIKTTTDLVKNDVFYLPAKYDHRGRLYDEGYDIAIQGDAFKKGMLIPTNQVMKDEPLENNKMREFDEKTPSHFFTAVEIANNAGFDKKPFEWRVAWVIKYLVKEDFPIENIIDELGVAMDNTWMFRNSCYALRDILRNGDTDSLVYLDASNQALQLYAVGLRDERTAIACNVVGNKVMADAYQMLADELGDVLNTKLFDRKSCKYALMTALYGKAKRGEEIYKVARENGMSELIRLMNKIGKDKLEDAIENALYRITPRGMDAMEFLRRLNDGNEIYYWTMPDGFKVKYDVKSKVQLNWSSSDQYGRYIIKHWSGKEYRADSESRGMAPNIIHSIDGYIVREISRKMRELGKFFISIHDAFGCRGEDALIVIKLYKDMLVEIMETNLLEEIATQVNRQNVEYDKSKMSKKEYLFATRIVFPKGNLRAEDIYESKFAIG